MPFTKELLALIVLIIVFSMPVESHAVPSLQELRAHGVVQESDDYYSLGEVRLLSKSKLSRRNAYIASESEAVDRLLRYVQFSEVKIPQSLVPLKGRLENVLEKFYPIPHIELRGMQLIHQNNDDHLAWSIIKVPRKSSINLKSINGNIDELIFRYVLSDKVELSPELFYECLSLNHKNYADDNLLKLVFAAPNLKNIVNVLKGDKLEQIPVLWWSKKKNFTDKDLRGIGDEKLLELLNAGVFLEWCHTDISEEFERRGYKRFSERLRDLFRNKPVDQSSQIQEKLIKILSSRSFKYPELPGILFFSRLLKMKMFLPIEDHEFPNDKYWEKAKNLFAQDKPDYRKVYSYCIRSIMETPTADAFNLMGMSLQLMKKSRIALLCYGQALQINPKHPHAAANLAVLLKKLGESKFAQQIALLALQNPTLSLESKNDLYDAGLNIHQK